jgi:hypothetical protein
LDKDALGRVGANLHQCGGIENCCGEAATAYLQGSGYQPATFAALSHLNAFALLAVIFVALTPSVFMLGQPILISEPLPTHLEAHGWFAK